MLFCSFRFLSNLSYLYDLIIIKKDVKNEQDSSNFDRKKYEQRKYLIVLHSRLSKMQRNIYYKNKKLFNQIRFKS